MFIRGPGSRHVVSLLCSYNPAVVCHILSGFRSHVREILLLAIPTRCNTSPGARIYSGMQWYRIIWLISQSLKELGTQGQAHRKEQSPPFRSKSATLIVPRRRCEGKNMDPDNIKGEVNDVWRKDGLPFSRKINRRLCVSGLSSFWKLLGKEWEAWERCSSLGRSTWRYSSVASVSCIHGAQWPPWLIHQSTWTSN